MGFLDFQEVRRSEAKLGEMAGSLDCWIGVILDSGWQGRVGDSGFDEWVGV